MAGVSLGEQTSALVVYNSIQRYMNEKKETSPTKNNVSKKHFPLLVFVVLCVLFIALVIVNLLLPIQKNTEVPSPTPFSPQVINPQGDTVIYEDADMQIEFIPQRNQYLISVLGSPFGVVRTKAEVKILEVTKLTQDQICGYDVVVTTPRFANPDFSGQSFGLSFCEGKVVVPEVNPNLSDISVLKIQPAQGDVFMAGSTASVILTLSHELQLKTTSVTSTPPLQFDIKKHPTIANMISITPTTPWVENTTYDLIIKAGAMSSDSKAQLKQNVNLRFQVKKYPYPSEGTGSNVIE
jgi:hypothetical protein